MILLKKKKQILLARVQANYIIAKDAINRAYREDDSYTKEMYADSVEHLTDNTQFLILAIGGMKALREASRKFGI